MRSTMDPGGKYPLANYFAQATKISISGPSIAGHRKTL